MKRTVGMFVAALILVGCGSVDIFNDVKPITVEMEDGTKVECVKLEGGHSGGLSCDWGNRR